MWWVTLCAFGTFQTWLSYSFVSIILEPYTVFYLSWQWYFNGHRDDLSQQAAIESHPEHARVTVWVNQRHLRDRKTYFPCHVPLCFTYSVVTNRLLLDLQAVVQVLSWCPVYSAVYRPASDCDSIVCLCGRKVNNDFKISCLLLVIYHVLML